MNECELASLIRSEHGGGNHLRSDDRDIHERGGTAVKPDLQAVDDLEAGRAPGAGHRHWRRTFGRVADDLYVAVSQRRIRLDARKQRAPAGARRIQVFNRYHPGAPALDRVQRSERVVGRKRLRISQVTVLKRRQVARGRDQHDRRYCLRLFSQGRVRF